jgi:hypothetical protein
LLAGGAGLLAILIPSPAWHQSQHSRTERTMEPSCLSTSFLGSGPASPPQMQVGFGETGAHNFLRAPASSLRPLAETRWRIMLRVLGWSTTSRTRITDAGSGQRRLRSLTIHDTGHPAGLPRRCRPLKFPLLNLIYWSSYPHAKWDHTKPVKRISGLHGNDS